MQCFLGDTDSGMLNLETHRLALAIAKKTLDENRLKTGSEDHGKKTPILQNQKIVCASRTNSPTNGT